MAAASLDAIDYQGGPLSQRDLLDIAKFHGFSIHPVQDFPTLCAPSRIRRRAGSISPTQRATNPGGTVRGLANTRPLRARSHGSRQLRRVPSTAHGSRLLRVGGISFPKRSAVPFLQEAKQERDLSVGDIRETFYVSYDMAAHRFTNLATSTSTRRAHGALRRRGHHLEGVQQYERSLSNRSGRSCRRSTTVPPMGHPPGVPFRRQVRHPLSVHRYTRRVVLVRHPRRGGQTAPPSRYAGDHLRQRQVLPGRETDRKSVSECPDGECCRDRPQNWANDGRAGVAQPEGPITRGGGAARWRFGVDMSEIYEFLERNDKS